MKALFLSIPKSTAWFALTGVIVLLQWFPYTGIFLMIVAAPLWPVVTINLGFLFLAAESLSGWTSRLWLIAPLVWFGGGAIAAWDSRAEFEKLNREVIAGNAGKQMAFDGGKQDLVISGSSGQAASLLQNFDIPVVFEKSQNKGPAAHRAYRIGSQEYCSRIRSDPSFRAVQISAFGLTRRRHSKQTAQDGFCLYSAPQNPNLPAVSLSQKTERGRRGFLSYELTAITLSSVSSGPVKIESGRASVLPWIPRPAIGCGLNSGRPSWDCSAGFLRESPAPLGPASLADAAAAALNLARANPSERAGKIAAQPDPGLGVIVRQRENSSAAMLDQIIKDPTVKATVHDLPGLAENTGLYEARAEEIVDAISRGLKAPKQNLETVRNLQRLLTALPPEKFKAIGMQLLRALEGVPKHDRHTIDAGLAARLGDLGPAALPLLERVAFENVMRWEFAGLLGLCRIGKDAARSAERVAAALRSSKRTEEKYAAAYITLLRFGRADLLAGAPDQESRYRKKDFEIWASTISPASPPAVCSVR